MQRFFFSRVGSIFQNAYRLHIMRLVCNIKKSTKCCLVQLVFSPPRVEPGLLCLCLCVCSQTDLQQPRVFEVFRPSTWSEINYTRTTVTKNKLLYVEALSHDLAKPAQQQGMTSPPLPSLLNTIVLSF